MAGSGNPRTGCAAENDEAVPSRVAGMFGSFYAGEFPEEQFRGSPEPDPDSIGLTDFESIAPPG